MRRGEDGAVRPRLNRPRVFPPLSDARKGGKTIPIPGPQTPRCSLRPRGLFIFRRAESRIKRERHVCGAFGPGGDLGKAAAHHIRSNNVFPFRSAQRRVVAPVPPTLLPSCEVVVRPGPRGRAFRHTPAGRKQPPSLPAISGLMQRFQFEIQNILDRRFNQLPDF